MTAARQIGIACALLSALGGFVAQAAVKEPLVLQPASQWVLDYADDSCRMVRTFGEGEEKTIFILERYEPGDRFSLIVGGDPLKAQLYTDTAFRFGPDGYEEEGAFRTGEMGEYSPIVLGSGLFLAAPPDLGERGGAEARDADAGASDAGTTSVFDQAIAFEQEAIAWLEIQRGKRRPVRLALGSMGPPMAAMRKCTEELLTHWGIDLESHRALTRKALPKGNPGHWVVSRDYPGDLASKGVEGLVHFRLSVSAEGVPTDCHIQRSIRSRDFDEAVCNALMRRARFEPALDSQGRPVASYWRSTVNFLVP